MSSSSSLIRSSNMQPQHSRLLNQTTVNIPTNSEMDRTTFNPLMESACTSAFVALKTTVSSSSNNDSIGTANYHQATTTSSSSPQHLQDKNPYQIFPNDLSHGNTNVEKHNGQSVLKKQKEINDSSATNCSTIDSTTGNNVLLYDRTSKVARTGYSDHGTHGVILNATSDGINNSKLTNSNKFSTPNQQQTVLKRLTCLLDKSYKNVVNNNTASFVNIDTDRNYLEGNTAMNNHNRKRGSPRAGITTNGNHKNSEINSSQITGTISRTMNISQGTSSLERVEKDEIGLGHLNNSLSSNLSTLINKSRPPETKKNPPAGLLHAALMGNGLNVDDATCSNSKTRKENAASYSESQVNNKLGNNIREPIRKCLSNPCAPELNGGLDNIDGNLIVHMHDEIRVPNQNIRQHRYSTSKDQKVFVRGNKYDTTKFEVLGLLGQGTFAQVFKCQKMDSGEMVAVKIVKNKPAYTRQAAIEIDIFQALGKENNSTLCDTNADIGSNSEDHQTKSSSAHNENSMVSLLGYFMYHSHLCLVFELLGLNLYEVLKQRQFCGLPVNEVRELVKQATNGIKQLSSRNIVHCDLKPENILMSDNSTTKNISDDKNVQHQDHQEENLNLDSKNKTDSSFAKSAKQNIKLIDFGSACFEGQTSHTYIQSRFYRSPEVLMGLDYDSAIDMWSLGCVAAELFLGLPILPGLHEHDQLGRICEMIGDIPNWMIEQGTKSSKYFEKQTNSKAMNVKGLNVSLHQTKSEHLASDTPTSSPAPHQVWRLKTREQFIMSLSEDEIERRGGLKKLEQQPTNRYFKRKKLADIIMVHGTYNSAEEYETLSLFVHFLKGILDPDPWKRWTAHQASMHPFITGSVPNIRRSSSGLSIQIEKNQPQDIYWVPPWDPSICRRKLLCVQKARDRQQSSNRSSRISGTSLSRSFVPETAEADLQNHYNPENVSSPDQSNTTKVTAMTDAMSLSQSLLSKPETKHPSDTISPPSTLGLSMHSSISVSNGNASSMNYPPSSLSCSLGTDTAPLHYEMAHSMSETNRFGNSASQLHGQAYLADYARFLMQPPPTNLHPVGHGQGEYPPTYQQFASGIGPQSYSGVYYESIPGGDLGYALQRPGVVPMGGESKSTNGTLSHSQKPGPPTNIELQGRSLSFSSPKSSNQGITRRTSDSLHSYGPSSYSALAVSNSQGFIPGSPHDKAKSRLQPSSFNEKMYPSVSRNNFSDSIPDIRNLNGTSFLAQKLAKHSSSHNKNQNNNRNQSWSDSQFVHVPNSMPNQTSYSYSNNSSMLYDGTPQNNLYNIGYLSAQGTPIYLSTSNPAIVARQAPSSYSNNGVPYFANQSGSYQDDVNSHSLPQHQVAGYPPGYSHKQNYVGMNKHQQMPQECMAMYDPGASM